MTVFIVLIQFLFIILLAGLFGYAIDFATYVRKFKHKYGRGVYKRAWKYIKRL